MTYVKYVGICFIPSDIILVTRWITETHPANKKLLKQFLVALSCITLVAQLTTIGTVYFTGTR